jgi:very-short-patch-repair endonuclease
MDPREKALEPARRRQRGLFTFRQAVTATYTRPAIRRRLASGAWIEVAPRVYRVATGVPSDDHQTLLAATLSTGAVTSGPSAAALLRWLAFPAEPYLLARRGARTLTHVGVHYTDSLPASDVAMVDGIPATRPARTLIELAAVLPRERFEDVVDTAIVSRVVTLDQLEKRARELRAPRRAGCAVVLDVVATRHPELARARNEMEAKVLRELDRRRVPRPRVNHVVDLRGETRIVDFAWPDQRIALELDGLLPHSLRRVFEDDRIRRNLFTAEGWQMYHVTAAALRRSATAALSLVIESVGAT